MLRRIAFLLILVVVTALPAQAGIWVSGTLPTSFAFSSDGNDLYDFDQISSTGVSGYSVLASIPFPLLPVVGMSEFTIDLVPNDVDIEGTNSVKFNTYDVAFDFSGGLADVLVGYGVGLATFECGQSDCESFTFEQREVFQYFGQIGVPFGVGSNFHIDMRRIIGRVQVDSGADALDLNLQGVLFAFGFRFGF